jgi:ADP-ribose pyrophosphatase YjhB (NUDIX family)
MGIPSEPAADHVEKFVPKIQTSVGALVFDQHERLLILKPTYKSGWTLPGGIMEESGETPWDACRREVLEECGLSVDSARLACVDFHRPKSGRAGGVRILFDCGVVDDDALASITLQAEEIAEHRLAPVNEALTLLRKAVSRRVSSALAAGTCTYLERGEPVESVT